MSRFTFKVIVAGWAVMLGGFISLAPLLGMSVCLFILLTVFGLHLRWIANRVQPTASEEVTHG